MWFHSPCHAAVRMARFSLRCAAASKRRWVERTPKHIIALARIFEQVPDAKIVAIVRDGRDVALSLAKWHLSLCAPPQSPSPVATTAAVDWGADWSAPALSADRRAEAMAVAAAISAGQSCRDAVFEHAAVGRFVCRRRLVRGVRLSFCHCALRKRSLRTMADH